MPPAHVTMRFLGDLTIAAPGHPSVSYRKPTAGLMLAYLACHPGGHSRDDVFRGVYGRARGTGEAEGAKFRGVLATLIADLKPFAQDGKPLVGEDATTGVLSLSESVWTDVAALKSQSENARRLSGLDDRDRITGFLNALRCHEGELLAGLNVGEPKGSWVVDTRLEQASRFAADLGAMVETLGEMAEGEYRVILSSHTLAETPVPQHIKDAARRTDQTATRLCEAWTRLCLLAGKPDSASLWLGEWGKYNSPAERRIALEDKTAHGLRVLIQTVNEYQRSRYDAFRRASKSRCVVPLIGREDELQRLKGHISFLPRLVLLTGPPGCGKTRLAHEACSGGVKGFGEAVFVSLEGVAHGDDISTAILTALGNKAHADPWQDLRMLFPETAVMVVLDNFEPLLAHNRGGREVIVRLLREFPYLTLLVTSQRHFTVGGDFETRYLRLSPLPTLAPSDPSARIRSGDAVNILLAYARRHLPDFGQGPEDLAVLNEICWLLDGLPLALKLAGDWARRFHAPRMILAHLTASPLEKKLKDQRARSKPLLLPLLGIIKKSLSLRTKVERQIFAQLSVFRGPWTAEDVESVCAGEPGEDLLTILYELVDSSLVEPLNDGGPVRFFLLPTLRQIALDRLRPGERALLARRHYDHFLKLAGSADLHLPDDLALMRAERENLHAALDWALDRTDDPELALDLAAELGDFWYRDGSYFQGRNYMEAVMHLARNIGVCTALAKVRHGAGVLASVQSDRLAAETLMLAARQDFQTLADRGGQASALNSLSNVYFALGRFDEARDCAAEALNLNEALAAEAATHEKHTEYQRGMALNLNSRGAAYRELGFEKEASGDYARCLELYRKIRDDAGIVLVQVNIGNLDFHRKRYKQAKMTWMEACALCRRLPDQTMLDTLLNNLGCVFYIEGDNSEARSYFQECLRIRRRQGYRWGYLCTLTNLISIDQIDGRQVDAQAKITEGLAMAREMNDRIAGADLFRAAALSMAEKGLAERASRLWGAATALLIAEVPPGVDALADISQVLDDGASSDERHRRIELEGRVREQLGEDGFRYALGVGLTQARADWRNCIEDALE